MSSEEVVRGVSELSEYSDQESKETVITEEEVQEEPVDPRSLLTQQQVLQFKELFLSLDHQGANKLPSKMVGLIIRSLGFNPTKVRVRQLTHDADPEGKGWMDFPGFLMPIAEIVNTVPEGFEDILRAFKILDESDVGYIDSNLLYEYLTTLGETLEDYEIDLLIKMADPKGEGKVYYEDFLEKMIGVPKKKATKRGQKDKKKNKKKKK